MSKYNYSSQQEKYETIAKHILHFLNTSSSLIVKTQPTKKEIVEFANNLQKMNKYTNILLNHVLNSKSTESAIKNIKSDKLLKGVFKPKKIDNLFR